METKIEKLLKGCEHDGSYIPIIEVKRLMRECLLQSQIIPSDEHDPYWYWPQCDVSGCKGVSSSGGLHWRETGYWSICTKHGDMCRAGKPQPKMRKSTIDREVSRDPETGYLNP